MHPENTLDATQTHPFLGGGQNLHTGRFAVRHGLGVWVESATTLLAYIRLGAVLRFSVLDRLDAFTRRTRRHAISTLRFASHYPLLYIVDRSNNSIFS